MTNAQFDAIVRLSGGRVSAQVRTAAHAVLVLGVQPATAAKRHSISRTHLNKVISGYRRVIELAYQAISGQSVTSIHLDEAKKEDDQ